MIFATLVLPFHLSWGFTSHILPGERSTIIQQLRLCLLGPHPLPCVHRNSDNRRGKCHYTRSVIIRWQGPSAPPLRFNADGTLCKRFNLFHKKFLCALRCKKPFSLTGVLLEYSERIWVGIHASLAPPLPDRKLGASCVSAGSARSQWSLSSTHPQDWWPTLLYRHTPHTPKPSCENCTLVSTFIVIHTRYESKAHASWHTELP